MKVVDKSMATIVIEVTSIELKERGFDKIWDEIRVIYPLKDYELESVKESHDGKIFLMTIRSLKYYHLLDN
jgi:hypothetical protein